MSEKNLPLGDVIYSENNFTYFLKMANDDDDDDFVSWG